VRVERLGERNNHHRDKDGESGERSEDAGHGRTILRAATRPAGPDSVEPPSTSAPVMSCRRTADHPRRPIAGGGMHDGNDKLGVSIGGPRTKHTINLVARQFEAASTHRLRSSFL
jgi:hypothetical protein